MKTFFDGIAKRFGYVPNTPKPKMRRRGYAASAQTRLTSDWVARGTTEDNEAHRSIAKIRDRARDLARNDDYAKKFLRLLEVNIVGPNGFTLQMKAEKVVKDPPEKVKDTYHNSMIEGLWAEQCDDDNWSTDGKAGCHLWDCLAVRTIARDGEVLARIVRGFDNRFRFAIQSLDAEQLDHEHNEVLPNGNQIRMGVEKDTWGRPVGYWIRNDNPNEEYPYRRYRGLWRQRYPASDIIHEFLPTYLVQTRGISWFHTAATRLNMLNGYEEAELVHARAAASKMATIETAVGEDDSYDGDGLDENGNTISEIEPGIVERLAPGQKLVPLNFDGPTTEFGNFRKAILRGIAAGLEVSYNGLANDLEGVNYSSIRAGTLDERDVYMLLQTWYARRVKLRIFREWLTMVPMAEPQIDPVDLPRFRSPLFIPRRWTWIDPEKDLAAHEKAIKLRLKSRREIIAESSRHDAPQVFADFKQDEEDAAAAGIQLEPEPAIQFKPEPAKKSSTAS